jgi:DNA-3-methyladenine glycosylase I
MQEAGEESAIASFVTETLKDGKARCPWVLGSKAQLYLQYHDEEWGSPEHEDKKLFEFLVMGSFQAGLSWAVVFSKRSAFRLAFDDFDAEKVAIYGEEKIEELVQNAGIIRHRGKIKAAINNARVLLAIQKEFGTFDSYVWSFVKHSPIVRILVLVIAVATWSPTEDETTAQLYSALVYFFTKLHPKFALVDFYIFGESYAGKYIPRLAEYIFTRESKPDTISHSSSFSLSAEQPPCGACKHGNNLPGE